MQTFILMGILASFGLFGLGQERKGADCKSAPFRYGQY